MTDTEYRIEHDTMGEVRVPKNALYAAQTQRAVENFPISGDRLEPAQIVALARIKKAAALANKELGTLDGAIADAIAGAADRIIAGEFADQFPIDVYQTGSGTSSNMNMNEVLATLATQSLGATVHPNDHVNASQSSNDVFPTSVHIAVTQEIIDDLIPALDHLAVALEGKAELWKTVVKSGRTHLMDATPVTLGQEFGGYARQIRLGIERVQAVLPASPRCRWAAPPSAPASTPPRLPAARHRAHRGRHRAAHHRGQGPLRGPGQPRRPGRGIRRPAHDRRLAHEDQQRPAVDGLGPQHRARRAAHPRPAARFVDHARQGQPRDPGGDPHGVRPRHRQRCDGRLGRASGAFELNVAIPIMGSAVLESIELLANTSRVLADKTIAGLEANVERAAAYAGMSPSIVTPLNKLIGYEAAAKIAKHSVAKGITVREAVIDLGYVERGELTLEQLDEKLDLLSMTHPG